MFFLDVPRLVAVKGFLYLILQQLQQAPVVIVPESAGLSQASSSQVGARGKCHEEHGFAVMTQFAPAVLLRSADLTNSPLACHGMSAPDYVVQTRNLWYVSW